MKLTPRVTEYLRLLDRWQRLHRKILALKEEFSVADSRVLQRYLDKESGPATPRPKRKES